MIWKKLSSSIASASLKSRDRNGTKQSVFTLIKYASSCSSTVVLIAGVSSPTYLYGTSVSVSVRTVPSESFKTVYTNT